MGDMTDGTTSIQWGMPVLFLKFSPVMTTKAKVLIRTGQQ